MYEDGGDGERAGDGECMRTAGTASAWCGEREGRRARWGWRACEHGKVNIIKMVDFKVKMCYETATFLAGFYLVP